MVLDMIYDPPERNPGKPFKWIIIDSLIVAGITFVSILPGDRLPNIMDFYAAARAFMYVLLVQISVEKGIKPYYYRKRKTKKDTQKEKGG